MSEKLTKKSVAHNYAFLAVMLGSMILGSIVGAIFPRSRRVTRSSRPVPPSSSPWAPCSST